MAEEVSEQPQQDSTAEAPQEEQPETPVEEAPKEEVEQEQPAEPAAAEEPEVATQPEEPEKEPEPPLPQELQELDVIHKHLKNVTKACEKVLEETTDLTHQEEIQKAVSSYSKSLKHLPEALQLLNDFRRFGKDLLQTGQGLQKELIALRGGDSDALSSEESRILVATMEAKATIVSIISALEHVLAHVRQVTKSLLSIISYEKPGFKDFVLVALREVRIDYVSGIVHDQATRVATLREDLRLMYELKDHAEALQSASQTQS